MEKNMQEMIKAGVLCTVVMSLLIPVAIVESGNTDPLVDPWVDEPLLGYSPNDHITVNGGLRADVEARACINFDDDESDDDLFPKTYSLSTTGGSGNSMLENGAISASVEKEWYDDEDSDHFNTAEAEVICAITEVSAQASSSSLSVVGSISAPLTTMTEDGEVDGYECQGYDNSISSATASIKTSPGYTVSIPFKVLDCCFMYGTVNLAMLGGAPPDIDYDTISELTWKIKKGYTTIRGSTLRLKDIGSDNIAFSGMVLPGMDYSLQISFSAEHITASGACCDDQGPNGGLVGFSDIFNVNVHFAKNWDSGNVEP